MGERPPKSTPGRGEGGPEDPTGRGLYDAATGLYEWYDVPEGQGDAVTWEQILNHFPLIIADLASEYGVRVHQETLMWAEFRDLVHGLLQTESRLWHATQPVKEQGA